MSNTANDHDADFELQVAQSWRRSSRAGLPDEGAGYDSSMEATRSSQDIAIRPMPGPVGDELRNLNLRVGSPTSYKASR